MGLFGTILAIILLTLTPKNIMSQNKTTEFSFILKPSKYGVGVFATHDIKKGTFLRLFGSSPCSKNGSSVRKKKDVPEFFRNYCIDGGESIFCPVDFGVMPVGWYMNHSKTPNAFHKNYDYYAIRDIAAYEEILIDYNTLGEHEDLRENKYYK